MTLRTTDATYDVLIEHDIMVPMRDGVHLATHVYFPARDGEQIPGSHPVVLNRTPYRKEDTARPDRPQPKCSVVRCSVTGANCA